MKLTELENKTMNAIAYNDYTSLNGGEPNKADDTLTWHWPDEFAQDVEISVNQIKGVLSSLVQKELIHIELSPSDHPAFPDEDTVMFTELGFKVWKANK